jgi:diguanylate cyclase (GGDEF)-like protein
VNFRKLKKSQRQALKALEAADAAAAAAAAAASRSPGREEPDRVASAAAPGSAVATSDALPEDTFAAEREAELEEMYEAAAERAGALESLYAAAAERAETAEARELEAVEREATLEAREKALAERVEIAEQMHRAASERVAALEAREQAVAERAEIAAGKEQAATERAAAVEAREMALAERDTIANARDRAAAERDTIAGLRLTAPRSDTSAADNDAELEKARLEAELQRAHLDALTGTFRREVGRLALRNEIERAKRADGKFVIAFVDVDGLKGVNERDGHAAGDRVLRMLGATMRANLRSYDPIVRFGGDEFVCGIASVDPDEVQHRIGVIDQSLRHATGVGITAGLAALTSNESLDELTERADAALLEAKRNRSD